MSLDAVSATRIHRARAGRTQGTDHGRHQRRDRGAAFHFGSDGEKPYPAPDGKNGVQDPHRACFRSAGAWDRDQRYKTGIKNTRR